MHLGVDSARGFGGLEVGLGLAHGWLLATC